MALHKKTFKAEELNPDQLESLTEEQKTKLQTDSAIELEVEVPDELPPDNTVNELTKRYQQQLLEREQQLLAMQRRLEQLETPRPAPDKSLEDPSLLFKDPNKLLTSIVKGAVAPLQAEFAAFKREKNFKEIRESLSKNPAYAPYMEKLGHILDVTVSNYEGDITIEFMQNAMGMIIGKYVTNQIPTVPFEEVRSSKPAERKESVVPAHLRPSSPPGPSNAGKKEVVLSELEKRLARERGLTDEQYVNLRDMPANLVAKKEEKK